MFSHPLDQAPLGPRSPPQLERHSERLLIKPLRAKSALHMHRRAALPGKPSTQSLWPRCVLPSVRSRAEAGPVPATPLERASAAGCRVEPTVRWARAASPGWWSPGFAGACGTPQGSRVEGKNSRERGRGGLGSELGHSTARRRKTRKAFRLYRWLGY